MKLEFGVLICQSSASISSVCPGFALLLSPVCCPMVFACGSPNENQKQWSEPQRDASSGSTMMQFISVRWLLLTRCRHSFYAAGTKTALPQQRPRIANGFADFSNCSAIGTRRECRNA